ncbi:metal-dependent hydrolase [Methanocalculus taiwanensis]|uniref:Metal-dependent hydrolase n=1 Tax=Methanocalculus taiwanensis TaxID=106207 RepID=A0ABD4TK75_9EURY|nr:metal-dependent hydrolase [Methanocalculus taiwanensis]MCQ1537735.1 metal-dependent hydrolase [Methanocalculus taiwanensis]
MFFFFHLLVGVATGLFLSEVLKSRRWFLPVAVGSILPDLIDKPLGHIIFAETIGYGRIIGHSLIFLVIILILAFFQWKYRGSIICFGLGIGVLLHLVLDSMWEIPNTFYFPLYGPFPIGDYNSYFYSSFWRELASPQEWLAFVLLIAISILILGEWFAGSRTPLSFIRQIRWPCMTAIGMGTIGIGIFVLVRLDSIGSSLFYPIVSGGDPFICALALIWCGFVFLLLPLLHLSRGEDNP